MKRLAPARKAVLGLAVIAGFAAASGCDIVSEDSPKNARVVVEGGAGEEFTMVTSNDFTITVDETGGNRDIFLNEADTVSISAPYNQLYSLGQGKRFYLKAFRETALAEPINVKVFVSGDQRFNSTSALADVEIEFLYSFR